MRASSGSRSSLLLVLLLAAPAGAAERLLYLEAQSVAGYSSARDKAVFYSHEQREVMQKPGAGFDLVQKLSRAEGDFGTLAVQGRLALNAEGPRTLEPQLYNAYFAAKTPLADLWLGHNRPAQGLSSVLDGHGLLMPSLVMDGFGFDRDWGLGGSRDFPWGDAKLSLTSGSGMPLRFEGNWLASGRLSRGVLAQDNMSAGFSLAGGKTLDTMGYHLMSSRPMELILGGADLTFLWDAWESRVEAQGGRRMGEDAYALFWRLGVNLLEESRLKLEAQPVLLKTGHSTDTRLRAGASYVLTSDLSVRAMYQYGRADRDHRVLTQLYYYLKL